MISYPPKEVIETFGERAAEGLEKWLGEVMKDTATRQGIGEVKQDIAVLSKRVEHLEKSVDEIKVEIREMRKETLSLIKGTIGTLSFFGTIISIMIFVGQFVRH
ncbi:MAG: hypothetical protein ACPL1H_00120 [bacterium]